ncbi:hypothetical protein ACFO3Q_03205, partial [Coralloluteibacterium thermophilus]
MRTIHVNCRPVRLGEVTVLARPAWPRPVQGGPLRLPRRPRPMVRRSALALIVAGALAFWASGALAQQYTAGGGVISAGLRGIAIGGGSQAVGTGQAAGTAVGVNAFAGGVGTNIGARRTDGLGVPISADTNYSSTAYGDDARAGDSSGLAGGVAVGAGSRATAGLAVALGTSAQATGLSSVSIGGHSTASGNTSIAIGRQNVASGSFSMAMGNVATATGLGSSALGHSASATGARAIAFGTAGSITGDQVGQDTTTNTQAAAADAIAIGTQAQVATAAERGIALGRQATASGAVAATGVPELRTDGQGLGADLALPLYTTAVGANSLASGAASMALGSQSQALGSTAVAVGANSRSTGQSAITLGVANQATAFNAIAVGRQALASADYAMAHGLAATASGVASTAMGHSAAAAGARSIAIGAGSTQVAGSNSQNTTTNTQALAADAIALGSGAQVGATASGGVGIGRLTNVTGQLSAAIGQQAQATAAQTVAIGFSATASATSAVALGDRSTASGAGSAALGIQAQATQTSATALGREAVAGHANSVALGYLSQTAAPSGTGWRTGEAVPGSTVSVGNATLNRRITFVADGAADSDAVTVRQLRAVGNDLTAMLGGDAAYSETGVLTPPTYNIGGENYTTVHDALEAQEAIVSNLGTTASQSFNSTAGALGGGSTYDPDTGTITAPVYTVDDGSGTATTEVTGVGGAVDNLDTRITAMQVGEAGLVQQVGPAGAADPSAGITVGAGTGGDTVSFANDIGAARRLVGVANATDANDAVNLSQLQSAIAAVEFAEGVYFQVNPGPDPDNPAGGAVAGGNLSTASGPEVIVSGDYGFGAGYLATVENDAESGVAIGHGARAGSDAAADPTAPDAAVGAVAIGRNAHAGHAASVALGAESATSRGAQAGYAAFGLADPQSSVGEVAVGAAGSERQITHVAAGSEATDAVNVAQLQGASEALGSSLAAGLGGGAAYDPATGTVSTPEYEVDDGSGTTPTLVSGVGGAVSNLDTRIVAIQTGAAGMVQQLGTGGTVDPAATITLGGNTGGTVIDIRNQDGALRRISGVLNPLEADDAVNMGWVNSRLESFEVSGLHFFHANPDGVDPDANDSVAIGSHAIAIGPNTIVNADFGVGMGDAVSIATLATDGVGIGRQATLTENATGSMALGADTTVDHADSVALGRGSATGVGVQTDYAAFGLTAPQSSAGEVSIGSAGVQRQITNLAAGSGDYDAVNVLQLRGATEILGQSIADAFGGTAAYDPDTGIVTLPTYEIEGEEVVGVDGAINNLFTRTATNENDIAALAAPETGRVSIAEANIQGLIDGQLGLVQQSDLSPIEPITVGAGRGGNIVDFTNANAIERRLTGVAEGEISADSVDAVSGSQLYATNQQVATNTADIGATRNDLVEALGGNAHYDADGNFVPPNYALADGSVVATNLGDALTNIDGRTTANTNAITALESGEIGIVRQADPTATITVGAQTGGTTVDFANDAGEARVLTGVADGEISETSLDAVNGSQLFATRQGTESTVGALGGGATYDPATGAFTGPTYVLSSGSYTNVGDALAAQDGVVSTQGSTTAAALGGGSTYDPATGTVSAPTYTVGGTAVTGVEGAITNIDGRTTNLEESLAEGTVGLVQQDATTRVITVAAGTDGDTVDFTNNAGEARVLTGVADGEISETSLDAINGSQLYATRQGIGDVAAALGGGALYDPVTGAFTGPTYAIGGTPYTNVGDALTAQDAIVAQQGQGVAGIVGGGAAYDPATGTFTPPQYTVGDGAGGTTVVNNLGDAVTNIDGRTTANESSIAGLEESIAEGTVGLVQQDATTRVITVAAGTDGDTVDFTNNAGEARVLTGVADGEISETSLDAINGSQLLATRQGIESVAGALGGGATYDPVTGTFTTPQYTVGDGMGGSTVVTNLGDAITNIDGRTINNESAIGSLESALAELEGGAVGLVRQPVEDGEITVGAQVGGGSVTFANVDGEARTLAGVAEGAVTATSDEAVAGSQLYATRQDMAQAYGGGAAVGADGAFTGPTYVLSSGSYTNVGDALVAQDGVVSTQGSTTAAALGGGSTYDPATGTVSAPTYTVGGTAVTGVEGAITNIDGRTTSLEESLSEGTVGLVQQDATTRVITVAAGTDGDTVDFTNNAGDARVLTGVADGEISETSLDAINGSQLLATRQGIESVAGALGGGATYDPVT